MRDLDSNFSPTQREEIEDILVWIGELNQSVRSTSVDEIIMEQLREKIDETYKARVLGIAEVITDGICEAVDEDDSRGLDGDYRDATTRERIEIEVNRYKNGKDITLPVSRISVSRDIIDLAFSGSESVVYEIAKFHTQIFNSIGANNPDESYDKQIAPLNDISVYAEEFLEMFDF